MITAAAGEARPPRTGLNIAYDSEIVITSPDGATSQTFNTWDAEAATVGAIPSAVDQVSISWSRPSARDHVGPATVALDLITDAPTHPVLVWDAEVWITGAIAARFRDGSSTGTGGHVWAHGWIDQVTTRRRRVRHPKTGQHITTWAHHVTLTDLVGRAAATKVGDTPWPEEGTTARLGRIANVAPYPLLSPDPMPDNWTAGDFAARDIDNQELLEPLRDLAAGLLLTIHDSPDGLVLRPFPGNALAGAWGQPADLPASPVVLSAKWLTDADRHTDRSARVTAVAISHVTANGSERENTTTVVRDPAATATAEVSITTDLVYDPEFAYDGLGAITTWAAALIDQTAKPIAVLDPVTVLLDADVGTDTAAVDFVFDVARICDLDGRSSLLVHIPDAPEGISTWHHLLGAEYTIAARDQRPSIRLTLAPTELAGQRALTWGDFPDTFATGNPATWAIVGDVGGGFNGTNYVSWGELTVSTIPKGP